MSETESKTSKAETIAEHLVDIVAVAGIVAAVYLGSPGTVVIAGLVSIALGKRYMAKPQ